MSMTFRRMRSAHRYDSKAAFCSWRFSVCINIADVWRGTRHDVWSLCLFTAGPTGSCVCLHTCFDLYIHMRTCTASSSSSLSHLWFFCLLLCTNTTKCYVSSRLYSVNASVRRSVSSDTGASRVSIQFLQCVYATLCRVRQEFCN